MAANETYNVVNGDMLVWQDVWGSIAQRFSMKTGAAEPVELTTAMPEYEAVWKRIVAKHQLRPLSLQQIIGSSWQFTDRAVAYGLANPADSVLSGIKLRQHGFADCIDTEDSIHHWLARMQAERLLPR